MLGPPLRLKRPVNADGAVNLKMVPHDTPAVGIPGRVWPGQFYGHPPSPG